jgi:hypothetical protein
MLQLLLQQRLQVNNHSVLMVTLLILQPVSVPMVHNHSLSDHNN